MKEIRLTKGYVAIVDDEDYEELNRYKWYAKVNSVRVYAVRDIRETGKPSSTKIRMHRMVLELHGLTVTGVVDHINHDTLDNRKGNLRIVTQQQNTFNSRKRTNTSSQFKGVSWSKSKGKWRAYITLDGKMKHLGYFMDILEAAKAYNKIALELFGEFACLNAV